MIGPSWRWCGARWAVPQKPTPAPTIDEKDASAYIGMTPAYLRKARRLGKGPNYIQLGRTIRYRVRDLDAWLEQHLVKTETA